MDLSIIIVNWNSKQYLLRCIASIEKHKPSMPYEIIVIDSGSFDGCFEALQKYYPMVRFIQSQHNIGFGRANNEAFFASNGQTLLFLNPDTEVSNQAIDTLYRVMQEIKNVGIVGAKLLNSDHTVQDSCVQTFPNIFNQIIDMDILRKRFPTWHIWGTSPLIYHTHTPQDVDVVSGACLMIKRDLFKRVNFFDEIYFMYSEDTDLCFKVRQAGFKNYLVPSAVIVHHGGASSSQSEVSTFSAVMQMESQYRYFFKTRSERYAMRYRIMIFLASIVRLTVLSCAYPLFMARGNPHRIFQGIKKWKSRLRWTLGLEPWVKDY